MARTRARYKMHFRLAHSHQFLFQLMEEWQSRDKSECIARSFHSNLTSFIISGLSSARIENCQKFWLFCLNLFLFILCDLHTHIVYHAIWILCWWGLFQAQANFLCIRIVQKWDITTDFLIFSGAREKVPSVTKNVIKQAFQLDPKWFQRYSLKNRNVLIFLIEKQKWKMREMCFLFAPT